MRTLLALALLLPAVLVGCGGSGMPEPAKVVRAWIRAVDAEDNEAAADLFARGAQVVQSGRVIVLHTHADAFLFNAALPCSGKIVSLAIKGQTATATFVLGNRKRSTCDSPGGQATATFTVRSGKIVVWHQLASAGESI